MKKRILFAAYTLDVGGIETALVNLLNELIKEYDITLVLEKKQGLFLNDLNKHIKIIEYNPNQSKNVLLRKTINLIKRINFILKYKNKFDFGASFATYSKMGSFCARTASKNNALWIHTDYWEFYKQDNKKIKDFFEFINLEKFKKIIVVSKKAKEHFINIFPIMKNKTIYINNIIDCKKIIEKSNETINIEKNPNEKLFLNISRHDEKSKKISRLINVADMLKNEQYRFRIILIGNGQDTKEYKAMVNERNLNDVIVLAGEIKNPYPFFKLADALVLTSDYEGYPVVFNEAKVLNLPIITTDISDSKTDINGKFGIVTNKTEEDIYMAMKNFILTGYEIKEQFDANKYNETNLGEIKKIIEG